MTWTDGFSIAADIATTIGVVALVPAYFQVRKSLQVQREATAIGVWKDFLSAALANPDLAAPQPYLTGAGRDSARFAKYEWFVAGMLNACEQLLVTFSKSEAWAQTVKAQLAQHRRYLTSSEFAAHQYSANLRSLLPPKS